MTRILLVGGGKMGGAMLSGWLDCGYSPHDIAVVDPAEAARAAWPHVRVFGRFEDLPGDFNPDVVVFAVKPQVMDGVAPSYRPFAGAVFLSIAAGKSLAYFARMIGPEAAVVRAMPNTPAAVRRGITVAVANRLVTERQKERCADLLAAVGEVAWVDDEALIDVVTAVSGSGPAYVFLLAETLAAAGVVAGLPEDLAARLARSTVIGAGELFRQSPESPAELRRNVTSPGGTTLAALQVLMGGEGLEQLLTRAVAAAARRSRELGD
jgi:pyrroline-5-carboxylate reductase